MLIEFYRKLSSPETHSERPDRPFIKINRDEEPFTYVGAISLVQPGIIVHTWFTALLLLFHLLEMSGRHAREEICGLD